MERAKVGLLLAKAETTYGTDAAPTAAANNIAVVWGQVTWSIEGEPIDRELLHGGYGRAIGIIARRHQRIQFRCELRGNLGAANLIGSGLIAAAVEIDPLLRACDLAATYTAETSGGAGDGLVTYKPTIPTNEGTSVTIWFYSEGKLYKATGCKGNIANIGVEAGGFAFVDFEFMGKYVAPSDSSIPASPAWLDTKPPVLAKGQAYSAQAVTADSTTDRITLAAHTLLPGALVKLAGSPIAGGLTAGTWYYVRDVQTNDFKLAATHAGAAIDITSNGTSVTLTSAPALLVDGWDASVFSRGNLKLGNTLVPREDGNDDSGIRGFMIGDRNSSGDIDPESVKEATHPFWNDWQTARSKPLLITVGTAKHNQARLDLKTKLDRLTYEDRNGKRIQQAAFSVRMANPSDTVGDEFKLIFF